MKLDKICEEATPAEEKVVFPTKKIGHDRIQMVEKISHLVSPILGRGKLETTHRLNQALLHPLAGQNICSRKSS